MNKDKWHKWFAWYPIEIDSKRYWLKSVWRIADKASYDDYGGYIYRYLPLNTEYRTLDDIKAMEVREILRRRNGVFDYEVGTYSFEESISTVFIRTLLMVLPVLIFNLLMIFLYK